jgi:hypothetical protein
MVFPQLLHLLPHDFVDRVDFTFLPQIQEVNQILPVEDRASDSFME